MLIKRGSDAIFLLLLCSPRPLPCHNLECHISHFGRTGFDRRSIDVGEDEQRLTTTQPSPEAAIELIHKQPVRWVHERQVSCDGGGGPLGHPRVYINVDKPQICTCGYCGLPFVSTGSITRAPFLIPHHSPPLSTLSLSMGRTGIGEIGRRGRGVEEMAEGW